MAEGTTPGLQTPVTADVSGFVGGLGRAITKLGGFRGAVGAASGALAVFAGGKALGASVRAFGRFDEAMTESQAIMGDLSQNTMANMEQAALDVSTATLQSADQAAESFFFLASAGLDAEQSIAALPAVAEFAQAGMFDMATATDLATDAQSALGLTVDDSAQNLNNLTRVTDVLVRSNQLANASVQQFADAITNRLGSRLRILNKDIEEGAAALAVLADQGVKGRRAGRGLNIVLRDLASRAVVNAEGFEALNIEVFDAEGNMRNLADIVEDFEGQLVGASAETQALRLEQLGLNRRAQDFLNLLIGASDELREFERQARSAGGAAEEVAEKQLETLNKQLELLDSETEAAKIQLGALIAPSLAKDVQAVRLVVASLREEVARLEDATGEGGGGGPSIIDRILAVSPGTIGGLARAREAWVALRTAIIGASEEAEAGEAVPFPQGPVPPEDGSEGEPTTREQELQRQRRVTAEAERQIRQQGLRLLEEELGLTSLALQREREKLQTMIRQEAAATEITNQAQRVAEIEQERREAAFDVTPAGTERFRGESGAVEIEASVPGLEDAEETERGPEGEVDREAVRGLVEGPFDDLSTLLETAAIPALDEFAGQLGIGTGALANFLDALLTSVADEFGDSGGLGGTLASLAGGFAGGFQHGGRIPSGKFGLVGEAGPEFIRGPATVEPAGQTVNINVQTEVRALDARGVDRVLRESGSQAIVEAVLEATRGSEGVSRSLMAGNG